MANIYPSRDFEVSYRVAKLIAKTGKPHTIGEDLILPAAKEMVGVMIVDSRVSLVAAQTVAKDKRDKKGFKLTNEEEEFMSRNTGEKKHLEGEEPDHPEKQCGGLEQMLGWIQAMRRDLAARQTCALEQLWLARDPSPLPVPVADH
ncbi:hypothetical protein EYF80_048215 [Liparis tanakae]|uniref:Uncharacterized protein n=1 Tax=Liparis tanakae TaxID=230148 RepID=A0A4Z2FMT4_9TELE|nr:hypothetical protein EYF80_048215 [Liparis tanakae]